MLNGWHYLECNIAQSFHRIDALYLENSINGQHLRPPVLAVATIGNY